MNSLPGISNDGEESYCQPGDEPDILIVRRGHHRNWSHSSPASPRPRLLLKRTVGFPHNTLLFVCVLWQTEDTYVCVVTNWWHLQHFMCVLLQTEETCNTSCVCCDKVRTRATLHVCFVTNWGHVQHLISCWCCWCQPWWMSERELLSDNLIRHMSLESYQVNTNNQIFYWWCCRLWECSDKGLILMCLYISHIHKHVQMTVQLVN